MQVLLIQTATGKKKAKFYFLWGFKEQKQKHCYKAMHVLGRELIQSSGLLKKSCCNAVGGISISRGSFFGHTVSGLQFSALAGAIEESTKRQQLFNKSRFYFKHAAIYKQIPSLIH